LAASLKAIAAALGVPRPAPFVERLVGLMRRKRIGLPLFARAAGKNAQIRSVRFDIRQ